MSLASNGDAIYEYAYAKLQHEASLDTLLGRQLDEETIASLIERLQTDAGNDIALARLNIEYLVEQQTLDHITGVFSRMPPFKIDYFDSLMQGIREEDYHIALPTMQICLYMRQDAGRLPTIEELNGALECLRGPREDDLPWLTKSGIGPLTNGIFFITDGLRNGQQPIDAFHPHVVTFLDEECDEWFEEAFDMTMLCLNHISKNLEHHKGATSVRKAAIEMLDDAFFPYAWENWAWHLTSRPSQQTTDAALRLLRVIDTLTLPLKKSLHLFSHAAAAGDHQAPSRPSGGALHICAHFGLTDLAISYMHAAEADVNQRNIFTGATPMHVAVSRQYPEFIKLVRQHAAQLGVEDRLGRNVLFMALQNLFHATRDEDDSSTARNMVGLFLDAMSAAELDACFVNGQLLLHFAIEQKSDVLLDMLLVRGINLDTQDEQNRNVLHKAADCGNAAALIKLVDYASSLPTAAGAVDAHGRTPLIALLQREVYEPVEMTAIVPGVNALLKLGTNLQSRDDRGDTALHHAVLHACSETVVNALLQGGSPLDALNNKGRTPLHIATLQGNPRLVKFLVTKGAETSLHDQNGQTSLTIARGLCLSELSSALGEVAGEQDDRNSIPPWQQTKIDIRHFCELCAAGHYHTKDWAARSEIGQTPLHLAVRAADVPAVRLVLQSGHLDVNAKDDLGRTALHSAVRSLIWGGKRGPATSVLQELLDHTTEIDLNVRDNIGRTAIDYAIQEICRTSRASLRTPRCWVVMFQLIGAGSELSLPRHQVQLVFQEAIKQRKYDLLDRVVLAGAQPLLCWLPDLSEADETSQAYKLVHEALTEA